MSRPRLLDLFCGAGGAAMGYHRAGFDVVGVDIKPQPRYPFTFIQADVMSLGWLLNEVEWPFDAIHASPPCQPFTRGRKVAPGPGTTGLDLLAPTRTLLQGAGVSWVIENVPGAPLENPVTLCGSMFGLAVQRHRLFESSEWLSPPGECRHREQGKPVGVYHKMGDQVKGVDHTTGNVVYGGRTAATLEEGQAAMGIDWMEWKELREAIPPDYTEWIGRQLLASLEAAA